MTKKVRSKKGGKLWRELPEDLIPAAKEGNIDLVKSSLRNEATDINARDANGLNALIWAAKLNNNDDVVRYLLLKGADVDELDETGMNALAIAVAGSKKNIVKALVEDGRSDLSDVDRNRLEQLLQEPGGGGKKSKKRRTKGRRTKGRRTKGRKSKNSKRRRKNKRRSSRRKIGSRSGGGPGGFSIKPKSKMIREKTDCCNRLISSTQDPNATLEGDCKNWFGDMTRQKCADRQACIARGGWSC